MTRSTRTLATGLAVLSLAGALTACGSKGTESGATPSGNASPGTAAGGETGAVQTGPGITKKTIKLGVLTDLSGVFAPLATGITHANELYWKERNAAGGVCGRQVDLVIKDYGYDVQKGVVQYREMGPDVAAMQQLLGSPLTTALLPTLEKDRQLSVLSAWPSSLLNTDFVVEVGTTYDLEVINGLDYLKDEGKISDGDTIGHLYFEGEYGENGLVGSKAYAEEHDLKIVEQKIQPTDEDMTGQVAAFKKAGVKAIVVTTSPTAFASLAGIAASQGMNVPLVGNNPAYDPALLKSPAAKALKANAIVVGSVVPYSADTPKNAKIAKAYEEAYPKDTPKAAVQLGYAQARVMYAVLDKACENGDLTRDGLVKAARQLEGVETSGLISGELNYAELGEPSTRAAFITKPADVKGGLEQIGEPKASAFAEQYEIAAG